MRITFTSSISSIIKKSNLKINNLISNIIQSVKKVFAIITTENLSNLLIYINGSRKKKSTKKLKTSISSIDLEDGKLLKCGLKKLSDIESKNALTAYKKNYLS